MQTTMRKTVMGKPIAWAYAQWGEDEHGRKHILVNRDCGLPLWSGKGEPPEIGAYVDIAGPRTEIATVLGYYLDDCWLMLWAERHSDGKRGDLAGAEIRYPEGSAAA